MRLRTTVSALAALALMASAALAQDAPPKSGNPTFDRTVELVLERFYAPDRLDGFRNEVAAVVAEHPDLGDAAVLDRAIDRILASLNASHSARYTPDEVSYYELVDIFRYGLRREIRRLFPPDGNVTYAGIGAVTAEIDGKTIVTDVYGGGPADAAGILAGDEIVGAANAGFSEIVPPGGVKRFDLTVRRTRGAEPVEIDVPVEELEATDTLLTAIEDSAEVVERDGHRIGYIRVWTYANDRVAEILARQLGDRKLAAADGLVLDLRGRWGGAPADAAEMFVGRSANAQMIDRDGDVRFINYRWQRPVVAIIDAGTRSGMEMLAYSLKKNGIPLVGEPTAGDVLAGTAFLLPDESLLILAVADVLVDGVRLEGAPVTPDIAVPFDVIYAAGADPQRDAAEAALLEILAAD